MRFYEGHPVIEDGNFEYLEGRVKYGQDVRNYAYLSLFFLVVVGMCMGGIYHHYGVRPFHEVVGWGILGVWAAFAANHYWFLRQNAKSIYEQGVLAIGTVIATENSSFNEGEGCLFTVEVATNHGIVQLTKNVSARDRFDVGDDVLVLYHDYNAIIM